MTDKNQELMVRILFALNCGKKMTFSELSASVKSCPTHLELCLKFLRDKMFVIAETIPETTNITYKISKRGIGILNMLDIWFKAKL